MKKLLYVSAMMIALSGCAALGSINQTLTSQKNPIVQAGITLAVATAIGNGGDQKQKAAAVKSVALKIYQASSAPAATIAVLEAILNTEIGKVANPGERASFTILAATLESYLQTYIDNNPAGAITAATLVDIKGVAQAVITATSFYGV